MHIKGKQRTILKEEIIMPKKEIRDKIYRKSSNIVCREIDNETILVPIARKVDEVDSIYTLNESGVFFWRLINGKLSLRQIIRKGTVEYGMSEKQLEEDIEGFTRDLEAMGCIELVK